ncbi:unnamed protein product [Soboliphyme baturini]|uniref:HisK-N-like domain-containing protein n=1 Tax=Soboliphyme baturini TaxID=241478 RepID=A0A183ITK7_9BILA|nr:unnamed protein product [Soboliphyme baturini]
MGVSHAGDVHSKFFLFRKDSERRDTLATIMSEYQDQIVDLWHGSLSNDMSVITKKILRSLLVALQHYILNKDPNIVRKAINFDISSISHLHVALYNFQDAMYKILHQQKIKPHWMFALDNLIRSALQCAVGVISPDLAANLTVQNSEHSNSEYSTVNSVNSVKPTESEVMQCTALSAANAEILDEFKTLVKQNRQLLDEILHTYRAYHELLISTVRNQPLKARLLYDSNATLGGEDACDLVISPTLKNGKNAADEELVKWLSDNGFDDNAIALIVAEEYTKVDLLEYVSSREELLRVGLKPLFFSTSSFGTWCPVVPSQFEGAAQIPSLMTLPDDRSSDSVPKHHEYGYFQNGDFVHSSMSYAACQNSLMPVRYFRIHVVIEHFRGA